MPAQTDQQYSALTYSKGRIGRLEKAANCRKLGRLLRCLPQNSFNMTDFIREAAESACGTKGCALGWAAMSGLFPGLQYVQGNQAWSPLLPVVNGEKSEWRFAGPKFFGQRAHNKIFIGLAGASSPKEVINALNAEARRLIAEVRS